MDIKTIASKSLKIQQNRQTAISLFNNFPHERLLGILRSGCLVSLNIQHSNRLSTPGGKSAN